MPWLIAFVGEKGGIGKTTAAHAAAWGLAILGHKVGLAHTDKNREPLAHTEEGEPLPDEMEARGYKIWDARSPESLEAAIHQTPEDGILIVDGGGNRGPVDDLLVDICHLVILPFTADDDSVRVVHKELLKWQLPKVWAMPSNWETNDKAQAVDTGYITKLENEHPGRILPITYHVHSLRDLTLTAYPGVLLTPARRYCRTLVQQLVDLMGTLTVSAETDAAA